MEEVQILLVEDEVLMAEEIAAQLGEIGYSKVVYRITYEEALEELLVFNPDVLILDIDLKGNKTGIDLARVAQARFQIPVIFLTSYNIADFKSQLKGIQWVSYLHKKVDQKNLHAALIKALEPSALQPDESVEPIMFTLDDRFFLKEDKRFIRLFNNDLLFIKANREYCDLVFLRDGKLRTIVMSLKLIDITRKWKHPHLIRVHRSYAVNLNRLSAFEGNMLFIEKHEIPLGPSYRSDLLEKIRLLKHT